MGLVGREMPPPKRTLDLVDEARRFASALRAAKSSHAWTNFECSMLANLCDALGVDASEHAATRASGEALAEREGYGYKAGRVRD